MLHGLISGILKSGSKYTLVGTSVPEGYVLPENVKFTADSKPLAAGEKGILSYFMLQKSCF